MHQPHVVQSSALYLERLEVIEKPSRRHGRLRGTTVKRWMTRFLVLLARRSPRVVTVAVLRFIAAVLQVGAALPGNQLLVSCRALAELARRRSVTHHPRGMYRAWVDGVRRMFECAAGVAAGCADEEASRIDVPDAEVLAALAKQHGGCIICVPHNTGAVFSSLKLSRLLPTVLLAKNPPSIERTRMALGVYEALGVKVLMVRGGNPFELARSCLRALRAGKILVATTDRIHRAENRVLVPFLGGVASLAPWPARIAAKAGVPIVPAYVHAERRGIRVAWGAPLVSSDPDVLMRHYAAHLEASVVEDPASWSFLADRRWRWVLQDAVARNQASSGGLLRPGRPPKEIPAGRPLPR